MRKSIILLKVRLRIFLNLLKEQLLQTPSLISLLILIPLILYFSIILLMPNEMKIYAINPNLLELTKSYNVMFQLLLFYTTILTAPIYIFISQMNRRSYHKYKHLNIMFKDISLSNFILCLAFINIIFFLIISMVLTQTNSSLIPSIVFLFIFLASLDAIIFILFSTYEIIISFIMKKIYIKYTTILEFMVVSILTLIIFLPTKQMTLSNVMRVPSLLIVAVLIVLTIALYSINRKITFSSSFIRRDITRKSKVILVQGEINILKNYFLMLFDYRYTYIEYILSFFVFIIFAKNTSLITADNSFISQIIIPLFLISNGIIYSYKDWFDLKKVHIVNKLFFIDTICSSICIIITNIFLTSLLYHKVVMHTLLLNLVTYLLLNILQKICRIKYVNDSKSPIIFILLYGIASFIIFSVLEWSLSYIQII